MKLFLVSTITICSTMALANPSKTDFDVEKILGNWDPISCVSNGQNAPVKSFNFLPKGHAFIEIRKEAPYSANSEYNVVVDSLANGTDDFFIDVNIGGHQGRACDVAHLGPCRATYEDTYSTGTGFFSYVDVVRLKLFSERKSSSSLDLIDSNHITYTHYESDGNPAENYQCTYAGIK